MKKLKEVYMKKCLALLAINFIFCTSFFAMDGTGFKIETIDNQLSSEKPDLFVQANGASYWRSSLSRGINGCHTIWTDNAFLYVRNNHLALSSNGDSISVRGTHTDQRSMRIAGLSFARIYAVIHPTGTFDFSTHIPVLSACLRMSSACATDRLIPSEFFSKPADHEQFMQMRTFMRQYWREQARAQNQKMREYAANVLIMIEKISKAYCFKDTRHETFEHPILYEEFLISAQEFDQVLCNMEEKRQAVVKTVKEKIKGTLTE